MMVETEAIIRDKICPKCGSQMVHRRRMTRNRPIILLQCKICRHYVVIDEE